ncbi:MAG: hypothetical protein JXB35_18065, partial [Anaerolineae bacterium]|nr:hypothetical protein [Anaerolineae bacterium]
GEPWTRYRTLVDLLDRPIDAPEVEAARTDMVAHPQVQALVAQTATWGENPFKRHNDASYPIYAFSTLADFGVRASDPGMQSGIDTILAHRSEEGMFQSLVNIPKNFGGTGEDMWTWILCDSPTLLYALLAMGVGDDPHVQQAVAYLVSLVDEHGWRCKGAPELGKFKGPGRRTDPCPIVNVYALKVLTQVPEQRESDAAQAGVTMLLSHWAHEWDRKLFIFGVGSRYRALKYPFVWYDILHVAEVLSHFPAACNDSRFHDMLNAITIQADAKGQYTATSMYRAWKDWSFASKKAPSPWLTFLVERIMKRVHAKCGGSTP